MTNQYLELLNYRALAELRRDAAGMYLGIVWWLLEPVLYMAVFYLVFGLGLRKGGIDFVLYLLCGLVPWKWLESTVRSSSGVIIASGGLMRQLYFPKWILPGYVVLANTYKFFIIFTILIVFLLFSGIYPTIFWLAVPVIVFSQFLFICSLSGLASVLVPVVPDFRHAVHYGMTMLFFLSGIFFNVSELDEPARSWLSWNPALIFIESYRSVLLSQVWPDWFALSKVMVLVLLFLLVVIALFRSLDRYFPRVVG